MTIFLIFFFLGIIGFMILIAVPFLTVSYFTYIFFMETSIREIECFSWLHNLIYKYLISWIPFNANIHIIFQDKQALDNEKQVIYGLHPHGLIAQGRILNIINYNSDLQPYFMKSYQGIHSSLFRIPILRELLLLGKCIPAHESFLNGFLKNGHTIALYPGGSRETKFCSDIIDSNIDYYYLKKRKGFVRLAVENQIPLIPIIFWEDQSHFQYTHTHLIKQMNKLIRILTGHTINLNIFQIIKPSNLQKLWNIFFSNQDQYVYIGKPIIVNNTDESVEDVHARYIKALEELYIFAKKDRKSDRELIIR